MGERLDDASPPGRGAPVRPSPAALRHVVAMVEFLLEELPAHFRKGGCLSCSNLSSCGGGGHKPSPCGSSGSTPHADPHQQLWRGVEELARVLKGTDVHSAAGWLELRTRVDDLARAFRAHFEDEEADFHRRVLEAGHHPHRRKHP